MDIVPISKIKIKPNRQRSEFDPVTIKELRQSIIDQGLLHPISVREEDGELVLVAGETRLKAIFTIQEAYRHGDSMVEMGHVPVVNFGTIEEDHAEELELFENVRRKNLTWKEETDAWARLHKLRKSQNPNQTKAQTVAEIVQGAVYSQTVKKLSNAILIQEHLDDPAVSKAKSEKEAMALIERKLAAKKAEAIAVMVTRKNDRHQVLEGDCRERMLEIPDGTVDCIITDPPYGIDADKHRAASTSEAGYLHSYDDSEDTAFSIMASIFKEGYRFTKFQAHLYMFLDFRHWKTIRELAILHGWEPYGYPIIWNRGGGMVGDYRRMPQRSYDMILYAIKGDKHVKKTAPDSIQIPMLDGMRRHHAAEKPVDLYENLLSRSVTAGDVVIDPCCGAGPIFPAANRLGCFAIGIEANPELATISKTRLEEK